MEQILTIIPHLNKLELQLLQEKISAQLNQSPKNTWPFIYQWFDALPKNFTIDDLKNQYFKIKDRAWTGMSRREFCPICSSETESNVLSRNLECKECFKPKFDHYMIRCKNWIDAEFDCLEVFVQEWFSMVPEPELDPRDLTFTCEIPSGQLMLIGYKNVTERIAEWQDSRGQCTVENCPDGKNCMCHILDPSYVFCQTCGEECGWRYNVDFNLWHQIMMDGFVKPTEK